MRRRSEEQGSGPGTLKSWSKARAEMCGVQKARAWHVCDLSGHAPGVAQVLTQAPGLRGAGARATQHTALGPQPLGAQALAPSPDALVQECARAACLAGRMCRPEGEFPLGGGCFGLGRRAAGSCSFPGP